jgi:prophage regulatory protein
MPRETKSAKVAQLQSSVAAAPRHALPETGYLRLRQIIGDASAHPPIPAIIPVGKSTWWAGVKSGRYPRPIRSLGTRITAWRVEDIRALIKHCAS